MCSSSIDELLHMIMLSFYFLCWPCVLCSLLMPFVFTAGVGSKFSGLSGALRELSVKLDRQQRLDGHHLAQLTGLQALSITETPDTYLAHSQVHSDGQAAIGHLGCARPECTETDLIMATLMPHTLHRIMTVSHDVNVVQPKCQCGRFQRRCQGCNS